MRKATVLWVVAALVGGAPGCRQHESSDARCRIFEQDPASADEGTLGQLREAYANTERIAECARAARVSVEEFLHSRKVEQKLHEVERMLYDAPQSILDNARSTIRDVKSGAEQAVEEAQRRTDEQLKAIRDMAQ
jgi:hypothetical protein